MWRAAAKPATKAAPAGDVAAALVPMAEVYLRAAGVGTIKDLAVWAGVAQRDAAAGQLGAIAVEVEGQAEPRVILPEARGLVDDADVDGAVALLPFEDNLLALGTPGLLIEPAYHRRQVPTWGSSKKSALGDARHLSQRTVVAESKIVGFWDCDPDARAVAVACYDAVSAATRKRIHAAAAELGRFLANDLGHGRSFSLDTGDELRVRWLRGVVP